MESSEIQELVKILIRQRDSAMSRCAELEAHLIIINRDLEKYKNEEEDAIRSMDIFWLASSV